MAYKKNYGFSPYEEQNYNQMGQRTQFVNAQGYTKFNGYKVASNKKYSGCKVKKNHKTFKGDVIPVVAFGWMKTRQNFISWVGSTADKKYQNNDQIMKLSVKVTVNGVARLAWGTYNPTTNMVYIQDLNIIGMPTKNSSFYRKSR